MFYLSLSKLIKSRSIKILLLICLSSRRTHKNARVTLRKRAFDQAETSMSIRNFIFAQHICQFIVSRKIDRQNSLTYQLSLLKVLFPLVLSQ